jgi:RimJ/RimL family protein N-acetyltransferase
MEKLRGKRVVLRPVSAGDRPLLQRWLGDRELRKCTGRRLSILAGARASIPPRDAQFLILVRENEHPIGLCGLFGISDNGTAEVGIVLGERDTWGRGYGPEALRLLLDHAYLDLGLAQVSLCVHTANTRAIRAYAKVGFVTEQRLTVGRWLFGRGVEVLIMTSLSSTSAETATREAERCSALRG